MSSKSLLKVDSYWILNKQSKSHYDQALMQCVESTITPNEAEGWLPAHRLDFETSGAIALARKGSPHEKLLGMFRESHPSLKKIYICGVDSCNIRTEIKVHGYIGSRYRSSKKVKFALSDAEFKGYHSLQEVCHIVRPASPEAQKAAQGIFKGDIFEVELVTGARHQIRAYFGAQGSPILGDPIYGDPNKSSRMELHSWKLSFANPLKPVETLSAVAPLI